MTKLDKQKLVAGAIEYLNEGEPIETHISEGKAIVAGAMEYLNEGTPINTEIEEGKPVVVGSGLGLESYQKFNKALMKNPSYKKYKGKAPYTKTVLKGMLWKAVKNTANNYNRAKKFLGYVEDVGGFLKIEDFILLMLIQDKFLSGNSDILRKIKPKNLKEKEKKEIKDAVESIRLSLMERSSIKSKVKSGKSEKKSRTEGIVCEESSSSQEEDCIDA